jgi:hypothetical protein
VSKPPAAVLAIVVAAGCGRLRFDDHDSGDAGGDASVCVWTAPRALTELDSASNEYGPWLSADELEIVFSSDRDGLFKVYTAQRSTLTAPFGAAEIIDLGASGFGDPYLSPDALTLWVDDTADQTILSASRATTDEPFAAPVIETELAIGQDEYNPGLSLDQLTITFDTATTTPDVIYRATRGVPSGPFSAPQPVPALDTGTQNCCVSFSGDGSFVLIGTDVGSPGMLHIFQSDVLADGTFGTPFEFSPTLVDGGGAVDSDPYITPGGDAVVFVSTRLPSVGEYDLFEVDRDCE